MVSSITSALSSVLSAQHSIYDLSTRHALHTARSAELSDLIRRERDCLTRERERCHTLRHDLLPKTRSLTQKLLLMSDVKAAMAAQRRVIEERRDVLREKEELVGLRRRKLTLQLSTIFPVIPLHPKREKEREKDKVVVGGSEKKKKRLNRYAAALLRPSSSAAALQPSSPTSIPSPPSSPLPIASPKPTPLPPPPPPTPPTSLSLTSHIPPARFYRLHDSVLPPFHQLLSFDDEKVSTALGYAALVLALTSKYWGMPLRYRIGFRGSRSVVWDECEGEVGGGGRGFPAPGEGGSVGVYPLYGKGVESVRFEYGVYFLNQNIEYMLTEKVDGWQARVQSNANSLEKLKVLLEGLMGLLR